VRLSVVAAMLAALAAAGCGQRVDPAQLARAEQVGRPPRIHPDYAGSVIPPNIAPLNFCVDEPGRRYVVRISSARGQPIEVISKRPGIVIPIVPWRRLLEANRGEQVSFELYVEGDAGAWKKFEPFSDTIAREQIDPYLAFRIINVLYNYAAHMKLYERNLETYRRRVVLDNASFGGCMNCHNYYQHGTERMVLQVRSRLKEYGHGMVFIKDGAVIKIDTRTEADRRLAALTAWHPSGRLLAFSTNKFRQFFHCTRTEAREAVDLDSDLSVFQFDEMKVVRVPALSDPDYLESWPEWSPDGRYLYFCRAPMLWSDRDEVPPQNYEKCRYDLVRIGYDVETGRWGSLETVLSADRAGMSVSQPRFSPDGRFLVFCMSDHSTFGTHQPDTDLYLMDMRTGKYHRMECNSDQAETWHSWSTNGRWLAFASKRGGGLFMKVYFTYVDENGKASQPFVLPQKDPAYYDSFIRVYQLPELIKDPIPLKGDRLGRAIRSGKWQRLGPPVTSASPPPRSSSPAQPVGAGSPVRQ